MEKHFPGSPGQDQGQRHGAKSLKLSGDETGVRTGQEQAGGDQGEGKGCLLSTPGGVRGCLHVLWVCGMLLCPDRKLKHQILYSASKSDVGGQDPILPSVCSGSSMGIARYTLQLVSVEPNKCPQPQLSVTQLGVIVIESCH